MTRRARITSQATVLLVRDVAASMAFWIDALGFSKIEQFGEPPEFVILRRDTARVMLGKAKVGHVIIPFEEARAGLFNAYFWVDDAKALFADFQTRKTPFAYEPELQSYGVLEFGVRDPDGQVIAFGEIIT